MKPRFLVASLLIATLPAVAQEGHSHGHAEVAIPATLLELWTSIQKEQTTLDRALENKDGAAVHTACETLVAYIAALPTQCAGVDEARLARVTGQAKNLARAYEAIHRAADGGAFDKAIAESTKAGTVLKLLAAQLPL